ncbi:MAG: chorismate mutase [Pseudonocardiaceae bacterium]
MIRVTDSVTSIRRCPLLAGAILAAVLVTGSCSTQPAPDPGNASAAPALHGLADLAVERIELSDKVAAAKFGTPQPIDDPAREQQVLDAVAKTAPGVGVDPAEAGRVFRDQIEASKVVQRGLYAEWTAHPQQRPTDRPNLGTEVRPELDRITTAILEQLRASRAQRHAAASCSTGLTQASRPAAQPLDTLHRNALAVALRSVCPPR